MLLFSVARLSLHLALTLLFIYPYLPRNPIRWSDRHATENSDISAPSLLHKLSNPDVILHQKPPFSHPFLQKVLSLVTFNPQSHPALGAHIPDAFDPLRLETLAFVCTMTHFALANLLKEKQQEFSADEYFLVYVDYLEMLKDFQAEEPEGFENHLMIMLADVIRKKKQTAGLSGDALMKELSMMTAAQPSQVPQGMVVAAVLALHGSATATIGNISQAMALLPAYGVPNLAPYGYPPGVTTFPFCYSPRSFAAKHCS
ncbi:hypothetical protein M422DRAFT_249336 [Sphaerobolus stellatus SS14]|uniref:DUF6532 domain-containing protein n=1 Tax=Sphaerobolus stellatus (strain SS14) TaxID=990650 RepID=A0A0C9W5H4_SPHS4|nr:hypothetical protein M422DRAFT_249336 [Sphaerobolus stellatus SS14]